jgi:hypothetical protein
MSDLDLSPKAAVFAFGFGNPTPATPPQAPPAAPAPPIPPAPPAAPLVDHHSDSGLSPEAVTMAGWIREDLAKGKMTQADADKAFDELGVPADQRAPDTRSPEVKMLDEQFPIAKETDYIIPWYAPGQTPAQVPTEVKQLDSNIRWYLHAAGATREQGNAIINSIAKAAQHRSTLSANEREMHKDYENTRMEQCWGPDWQNQLGPAKRMIAELEAQRPGLSAIVEMHGDNAIFLAELVKIARHYDTRKGR